MKIGVVGVAGFVVGFRCGGFVPWVFFFWWLGVKVMVGGSGCGCGRGLSVMSLKSSGHGGFESKYQREGEVSLG